MSYSLAPHVTAADTDDGMVLLHETTGRYWMLNATGAAVVRSLREGKGIAEVVDELGVRFSQDTTRLTADVNRLLEHLLKAGLVTA
ncbi:MULTISPECIES: lasso peptide biosynthesis PqqD family chaperone [Streptomyces]|uniref:lasso peptide biosynthesis PqqD family chaperone n=1 Tax=Streptomyces TaxID=1883 RepID=UPI001E65084F|nr:MULTISPECIES: lasso peptide biosynthesis PqqD family chaperone [Streptomyces]UFQ13618.1 lasso peptide biosynthesis PqqD family chaperone [Streptomyces huasconensis]WCL83215.1 lasso peptide biosynthesis PqqD family chaperone [Streptomyces sp. JCM 35825]